MTTYENHRDWIESLEPGNTVNAAALRTGINTSTLTRRLASHDGKLDADRVIRIALAYNVNPIRALIDTGIIPEEALEEKPPTPADKKRLLQELVDQLPD